MRIQQIYRDLLQIEQGSLYPALYRLERQRLIAGGMGGVSENNRQAKFYKLTRKGRAAADAEQESWQRLSKAVTRVLRAIEQGA